MSEAIDKLVALARAHNLTADEANWSKAFVYWFDAIMPADLRAAGNADASIEHFDSDGTPHSPAGEGFIDRDANVAISFLLQAKR